MSILNPSTDPGTVAANQVQAIIRQQFQQLKNSGLQGYNLIWNNPRATPYQVIAALGTNAAAVFQLANLNIETVTAAANLGGVTPPTLPEVPSQYVLTFNSDGSANLVASDPSSSNSSNHH